MLNLTAHEILEEYYKCLDDPIYAIENYLETFDKTQNGFVPFKLFQKQKEIINSYIEHRFNMVTKPRQAGVTTTTAAYLSILTAFASPKNPEQILILANKQDMSFEFLDKIKGFLIQIPRWVWGNEYYGSEKKLEKPIFLIDSKKEIKLPNKSRIKAVATSKDALRGFTPTVLIMDEAAFIENGDKVFGAALTALGCITKDSLILTDNGLIPLDNLIKEKNKIGFSKANIQHKVCNKNGNLSNITKTFVSEFGETFKIKTKLGLILEGSWKHPIMIKRGDNNDWVKLNELAIGDKPIIQYNQNYFGNVKSLNPCIAYLAGLLCGGGEIYNNKIVIKNYNKKIYIKYFLLYILGEANHKFNETKSHVFESTSSDLINLLNKLNFNSAEIPLELLEMDEKTIIKFLRGIFEINGSFISKKIEYSFISKNNVKIIQILLLNLGIISKIKDKKNKYTLKIKTHHINKFINKIFKNKKYNKTKAKNYIDEIVSIEKSENYTYDLHVPSTNSFISNGFISHNTGGRATLISTPNGKDKLYYKTYHNSIEGDNDFHIVEMKWYQDPRYNKDLKWIHENNKNDIITEVEFTHEHYTKLIKDGYNPTSSWYREMCRGLNGDHKMIAQELDVSFIGSGGNVIDNKYIKFQERYNKKPPLFISDKNDKIWVWEKPIKGHKYILSSDVSRGDGADSSTIIILDFDTMNEVMEYKGKVQPDLLAYIIDEYARIYNALVVVDITGGMGVGTINKLLELKTPNLYYGENAAKPLEKLTHNIEFQTNIGKYPGFNVWAGLRTPMVSHLEFMIRTNGIKVRSARLINEMESFIYKNGRADHQDGYHDDLLMALAMALWVIDTSFKKLKKSKEMAKAMLSGWIMANNEDDSAYEGDNFVSKKDRGVKSAKKPKFSPVVSRNMQDPTGKYMWLFSGTR